jgi:hypothetical protein
VSIRGLPMQVPWPASLARELVEESDLRGG